MDWRDQLDWKNPVTTRVRVTIRACFETDVLSRVPKMLVKKKSANDTNRTMIAVLCEREGPRSWNNFFPWTSATATSAMTNNRTAWLRAPIMERRVKATIFKLRWRPRMPSSRMTERSDSDGASSVLGRDEM